MTSAWSIVGGSAASWSARSGMRLRINRSASAKRVVVRVCSSVGAARPRRLVTSVTVAYVVMSLLGQRKGREPEGSPPVQCQAGYALATELVGLVPPVRESVPWARTAGTEMVRPLD